MMNELEEKFENKHEMVRKHSQSFFSHYLKNNQYLLFKIRSNYSCGLIGDLCNCRKLQIQIITKNR